MADTAIPTACPTGNGLAAVGAGHRLAAEPAELLDLVGAGVAGTERQGGRGISQVRTGDGGVSLRQGLIV